MDQIKDKFNIEEQYQAYLRMVKLKEVTMGDVQRIQLRQTFFAAWSQMLTLISDKMCTILTRTMAFSRDDDHYPHEWTFDEGGEPVCTSFSVHDWSQDSEGIWNDPGIMNEDPNQLKIVFDMSENDIL